MSDWGLGTLTAVDTPTTGVPIVLPSTLDQRTLDAAREEALAAIPQGPLVFDGSGVTRVGTVGIQFLMSAARSATDAGQSFSLIAPSPALAEAIATLGLEQRFSSWIRS